MIELLWCFCAIFEQCAGQNVSSDACFKRMGRFYDIFAACTSVHTLLFQIIEDGNNFPYIKILWGACWIWLTCIHDGRGLLEDVVIFKEYLIWFFLENETSGCKVFSCEYIILSDRIQIVYISNLSNLFSLINHYSRRQIILDGTSTLMYSLYKCS